MKYITTWSIKPENMKAVIKRFQEARYEDPGCDDDAVPCDGHRARILARRV